MLLNGTLQKMLDDRPQLKYMCLHNIDTVGADIDPGMLGLFASNVLQVEINIFYGFLSDRDQAFLIIFSNHLQKTDVPEVITDL